jgi:hypothetical protein
VIPFDDIRQHKLLALRAVLTGTISILLLWALFAMRLAKLDDWLYLTGLADIRHVWRGGTSNFSHFLIGGSINFTVGWIVGRLHRNHCNAMVSAFFIFLLLVFDLPRVIPAALSALSNSATFASFIGVASIDFIFLRLPILAGGICAVRSRPKPGSRTDVIASGQA